MAGMNEGNKIGRYGFSILAAIIAFAIVNCFAYWSNTPPCCDWTYRSGLPFRFLEEGGFQGMRRLLWRGVVADLGSIVVIALAISWVTTYIPTRKWRPH